MGWGSPFLPPARPRAHLLKGGVPLLGCDNELDTLAHVVLKLAVGEEVVGRAVSGLPTLSGVLHCPLKHRLSLVSLAEISIKSIFKARLCLRRTPWHSGLQHRHRCSPLQWALSYLCLFFLFPSCFFFLEPGIQFDLCPLELPVPHTAALTSHTSNDHSANPLRRGG